MPLTNERVTTAPDQQPEPRTTDRLSASQRLAAIRDRCRRVNDQLDKDLEALAKLDPRLAASLRRF